MNELILASVASLISSVLTFLVTKRQAKNDHNKTIISSMIDYQKLLIDEMAELKKDYNTTKREVNYLLSCLAKSGNYDEFQHMEFINKAKN